MLLRALVAAIMVISSGGDITAERAVAAPVSTTEPVAFVVEGTGFGHGRGLSQWGAYGYAVDHGWTWQRILDHYYGGTTLADAPAAAVVKVRLLGHDNRATTGVVSLTRRAHVSVAGTTAYAALQAVETARNTYSIYSAPNPICPGASLTGWTLVRSGVPGPVTFTTSVDQSTAAPGDVLGLCATNGSVAHYRGSIRLTEDSAGANRVVNDVLVEPYLRGVVSREVSSGWGNAGGGAGMHALRAQAVAARSYALAQNRYGYATTCDTTSCQAYGGAAYRASPTAPTSTPGSQVCESGNTTFECATTNRAISETARKVRMAGGKIVSTEFSASNGPRTAGGAFPAVNDLGDDVVLNPNHRWTRVLDADTVAAVFQTGRPLLVRTERDPTTIYDGIWGNRVRLETSSGLRLVTAPAFRSAFGLPSPGFTVRPITRDAVLPRRLALVGDSIGVSVTESGTAELPALLEGVFTATRFDSVVSRCTSGCGANNGIDAARAIPIGTSLAVVELGYNDASAGFAAKIDQLMTVLRERQVSRVLWVNLADRVDGRYAPTNTALQQATARWPELRIANWQGHSTANANAVRWFARDGVHLTATGQAEFALFLRGQILAVAKAIPSTQVSPTASLTVPVLGRASVPTSGVRAVSWNVTVTGAQALGYATVWPCASAKPATSNVNFVAGQTIANAVVAGVDTSGKVCVASSAAAHVVVDSAGWFGTGYQSIRPARLNDTRPGAPLAPGAVLRVRPLGRNGVPASGVRAVALNVTTLNSQRAGWATAWPCGAPRPNTSSVNFAAGQTIANTVIGTLGSTGEVCVAVSSAADVLVDVNGYFSAGFTPIAPVRLLDTRSGTAPAAGSTVRVPVTGRHGVPTTGVSGMALNVTMVKASARGWATVWPCGSPKPSTSNVNVESGATGANAVVVPVDGTGAVCVSASTSAHLLVDASGWFGTVFKGTTPQRVVDTRAGFGPTPGG